MNLDNIAAAAVSQIVDVAIMDCSGSSHDGTGGPPGFGRSQSYSAGRDVRGLGETGWRVRKVICIGEYGLPREWVPGPEKPPLPLTQVAILEDWINTDSHPKEPHYFMTTHVPRRMGLLGMSDFTRAMNSSQRPMA